MNRRVSLVFSKRAKDHGRSIKGQGVHRQQKQAWLKIPRRAGRACIVTLRLGDAFHRASVQGRIGQVE